RSRWRARHRRGRRAHRGRRGGGLPRRDGMRPLLLLVDLQRDYLDSPGLEPAAGLVTERAASLLGAFREADAAIVHAWTTVSRSDDRRMPHWQRDGRWLCEEGTPGHEPPPELKPLPGERVIDKTAFSAFEDGE